jgi:hypothetical protein
LSFLKKEGTKYVGYKTSYVHDWTEGLLVATKSLMGCTKKNCLSEVSLKNVPRMLSTEKRYERGYTRYTIAKKKSAIIRPNANAAALGVTRGQLNTVRCNEVTYQIRRKKLELINMKNLKQTTSGVQTRYCRSYNLTVCDEWVQYVVSHAELMDGSFTRKSVVNSLRQGFDRRGYFLMGEADSKLYHDSVKMVWVLMKLKHPDMIMNRKEDKSKEPDTSPVFRLAIIQCISTVMVFLGFPPLHGPLVK